MAIKWFAQVEPSLLHSKRLASLFGPGPKFAYMCIHLSLHCIYSGIFKYPKAVFALDAGVDEIDLDGIIQELVNAKLIEFDHDDEIVRIVRWHHGVNGATNSSMARSRISGFRSGKMPFGPLIFRSVAEFSVAIVKRSLDWNPEKGERDKLHERLPPILEEMHQEGGGEFLGAISAEIGNGRNVSTRALFSLLPEEHHASTMGPLWAHRIGEERTSQQKERKEKKNRAKK